MLVQVESMLNDIYADFSGLLKHEQIKLFNL